MGTRHAGALAAAYPEYASDPPAVGDPPPVGTSALRAPPCRSTGSRSRAKSRDIRTFLSVLGESGFFSSLLIWKAGRQGESVHAIPLRCSGDGSGIETPEAAGAAPDAAASTTNHSDIRGLPGRAEPHDRVPSGAASGSRRESPGPPPEWRIAGARALQSCLHRARIPGGLRMGRHGLSCVLHTMPPGPPTPSGSARPRGSRPVRGRMPLRRPAGVSRVRPDAESRRGRRSCACHAWARTPGGWP